MPGSSVNFQSSRLDPSLPASYGPDQRRMHGTARKRGVIAISLGDVLEAACERAG